MEASELTTETKPQRGRGKGKNPSLVHVNLRVPREVVEYFRTYANYTGKMREVLAAYAANQAPPDGGNWEKHDD